MTSPSKVLPKLVLLLPLFIGITGVQPACARPLDSGAMCLTVEAGGALCFALTNLSAHGYQAASPLCLQILTSTGQTSWASNSYSAVTASNDVLHCAGTIHTTAGSVFDFVDTIKRSPQGGSFLLQREVTVRVAAAEDAGFLTRFSVSAASPRPLDQYDVFIPGIWYQDNRNMPAYALAADLSENYFICREDRMPLPLVMMRDKTDGATLTLIHANPDGATSLADYSAERVVNRDIHVASLGVFDRTHVSAALYYPATEGERSYLRPRRGNGSPRTTKGWAERFYPVQTGVTQSYTVLISLSEQPAFPQAMRYAWRLGYEMIHPPLANVDIAATYEASVQLIAHWSRPTGDAAGVPFRLRLPEGKLEDEEKINYQMGFVGQQIPLAYHLLRYGLLHTNEALIQKGEAMMNFWATRSLTADGLPRTWYDTWPEPHWRDYNTFLRVASDGMEGALMACDVMAAANRRKPEWLAFCRRFGDWLVKNQNTDGSWYREYNFDGTPANKNKQNSCHPIPYLIDLSKITGDRKYLEAALRAGNWCWTNTHQSFCYIGGTVDNPNVTDKEAGFMALKAFLALHDATGESRWLDAAKQAADFTETWAYCWDVPIPADDSQVSYPRGVPTTGFSLIACGHSGADLFLAGAPFYFYRLYLQTGDAHYAAMARQFLYNTRQCLDLNGSLGYGYPGLCTEALSLAPPRGHGVNTWLPWLSYSMMEPVVQLQETYGTMDTPLLNEREQKEFLIKDGQFALRRGLRSIEMRPPQN